MKNKISITIGIIVFLILLFFIGCIEEDNTSEHNVLSWEVINCDKKTKHFIFNWSDNITGENYSKVTSGISNVSLTIKNTGNIEFSIKVDFEFILSEILRNEDTESQTITSNKCPCDAIEIINNNSRYYSKIISLQPGDIKTIYTSFDSAKFYGFKAIKWCYEINNI